MALAESTPSNCCRHQSICSSVATASCSVGRVRRGGGEGGREERSEEMEERGEGRGERGGEEVGKERGESRGGGVVEFAYYTQQQSACAYLKFGHVVVKPKLEGYCVGMDTASVYPPQCMHSI